MKKIKNKGDILNKINFIIIISLIVLIPITFFINYFSLYHFNSNFNFKIHHALTFILPIEIFIYFYKFFKREFRINVFDLLIYCLILIGLLSSILSEDLSLALWGSKYRFEGLIQICAYYFLFLNSRFVVNKKDMIIKIINSLLIIGVLQFIYSFLQVFVRGKFIYVKYELVNYRASGFIGHPNMLGSYIVLTILLALGMYFLYNKNRKFYLISSIVLYCNLVLTQSTGPFYGFCAGLLFMIVYLFIKNKIMIQEILIIICCSIIGLLSITMISSFWCEYKFFDKFRYDFTITGDIVDSFSTIKSIITGEDNNNKYVSTVEKYGSNRIWLWKRSLKLVPKYWLFGAGIDHFAKVFPTILTEEDKATPYLGNAYFDRAHNDYLQLLITQGIFALISYILLLFLVFFKAIKSKNPLAGVLMFGFVGYAIQAFTNISVYNVAPFFFITMGMLVGLLEKDGEVYSCERTNVFVKKTQ